MDHWEELLGKSNEELAKVDPLVMNLLVAKGIPSLANLDIAPYRDMMDEGTEALRGYLPAAEENFRRNPEQWKNDIRFARLALMCWYVSGVIARTRNTYNECGIRTPAIFFSMASWTRAAALALTCRWYTSP